MGTNGILPAVRSIAGFTNRQRASRLAAWPALASILALAACQPAVTPGPTATQPPSATAAPTVPPTETATATSAPSPTLDVTQIVATNQADCTPFSYDYAGWSPDGSLIYYGASGLHTSWLFVSTSQGKDERLLASDVTRSSLSPDGTMIIFERRSPTNPQTSDYYLLDLKSGDIRLTVTSADSAFWSPDSQWFGYLVLNGNGWEVWKYNVRTGENLRLTPPVAMNGSLFLRPRWSPDGKTIIFISTLPNGHGSGVMQVHLDTGQIEPLDVSPLPDCAPPAERDTSTFGWLPGSQTPLVGKECDADSTIYAVPPGGPVTQIQGLTELDFDVSWSPDGKHLAYTSRHGASYGLTIADWDGGNAYNLDLGVDPHWSPDGSQILFQGLSQDYVPDLFTINLDGSGQTRITHNPGRVSGCH